MEDIPLSIEILDSVVVITDFGDVEGDGIPATSEHNTIDSNKIISGCSATIV
jgi:hypothetical protein